MTLKDRLTDEAKAEILENSQDYPETLDRLLSELDEYDYVHQLPWAVVRRLYIWTGNNTVPIGMINPYAFFK
jgi:hypothetical protein